MRVINNFFLRVRNLVVHEIPVLLALSVAAANTATDKSVKGYVVAVGIALVRFAVSPAFSAKALDLLSPKLIAAIEAALRARGANVPVENPEASA